MPPAFPKPWIATVAPRRCMRFTRQASWATKRHPRAVASLRPSEPPSETGFPVTTPRLE